MKSLTEIEWAFIVPPAAGADVSAEVARSATGVKRSSLDVRHVDTDDGCLARAGLDWRLRREGRHWVQALAGTGANAAKRPPHEVIRPDASHDALEHAGTPLGKPLIEALDEARADGNEARVRYRLALRRTARRIRTRGAIVEVALDRGRLESSIAREQILRVDFKLVSGSTAALLALADRWLKRFGLVHDPRSLFERCDRIADGVKWPPLRKAELPCYPRAATAIEAFGTVLDECLAQVNCNAIGLVAGDPSLRVEHVHQLRVGIRRLRSALRSFRGWTPTPPAELVVGLRTLFATLGLAREGDVLDSGVAIELAKVGAPPLALPAGAAGPKPSDSIRAVDTQHTLLAWMAWRVDLRRVSDDAAGAGAVESRTTALPRRVERRLRQWHRRILSDWNTFQALDDAGLHELRKRIKRQRYAVEFFAPMLRRRRVDRYLRALAPVQDRLGELNDLIVARDRYQALVSAEPTAWFALGWLAARIAETRALAKPELGQLVHCDPPTA